MMAVFWVVNFFQSFVLGIYSVSHEYEAAGKLCYLERCKEEKFANHVFPSP